MKYYKFFQNCTELKEKFSDPSVRREFSRYTPKKEKKLQSNGKFFIKVEFNFIDQIKMNLKYAKKKYNICQSIN